MSRRVRSLLGALALACPADARADAFVGPPGKTAIEASVGLDNAAEHPGYTFVLWPDACTPPDAESAGHTILAGLHDDDGRTDFFEGGCDPQRLFAFPRDTYAREPGDPLPQTARAQLGDKKPTDPRVLVAEINAPGLWWVPDDVPLARIRDVYRVELAGDSLSLVPTRVVFGFDNGAALDRPFHKGRRPRLPRPGDTPPPPPPAPPLTGSPAAPLTTDPAAPPPPEPAASPTAAAPTTTTPPPAPAPPRRAPPRPWPTELIFGGLCLLVALAAGLALRRRPPSA